MVAQLQRKSPNGRQNAVSNSVEVTLHHQNGTTSLAECVQIRLDQNALSECAVHCGCRIAVGKLSGWQLSGYSRTRRGIEDASRRRGRVEVSRTRRGVEGGVEASRRRGGVEDALRRQGRIKAASSPPSGPSVALKLSGSCREDASRMRVEASKLLAGPRFPVSGLARAPVSPFQVWPEPPFPRFDPTPRNACWGTNA